MTQQWIDITTYISVAVPVISSLIGLILKLKTTLKRLKETVKERNAEAALNVLKNACKEAVKEVEIFKTLANGLLPGITKKEMALTKVNQRCIEAGIAYNASLADKLIEEFVTDTKAVNAREKDKREESGVKAEKPVGFKADAATAASARTNVFQRFQ